MRFSNSTHTHKRASKPTCCHSYLEDILWCDKCPMWGLHGNQLERVKIPIAGCPHAAWPWPGLPWLATETACSRVEHLAWGWAPLFSWDRMMAHCQKLLPNYILWGAKKRKSWLVALATLKHSTRNQSPKSNRKLRQQRVEHTQLDAALCELSDNFRAETLPEKGLLDHGHVPGRSKLHFKILNIRFRNLGFYNIGPVLQKPQSCLPMSEAWTALARPCQPHKLLGQHHRIPCIHEISGISSFSVCGSGQPSHPE